MGWSPSAPLDTISGIKSVLREVKIMKRVNSLIHGLACVSCAALLAIAAGCNEMNAGSADSSQPAKAMASDRPTIRIKAGIDEPLKDSTGVTWAADAGFDGGQSVDRPELQITGTKTPEIYRSEHYSMDAYHIKVPNGSYLLKLHFSEDYEGITDPTMRLFTYAVKDGDSNGKLVKEVKDFSPWKASGAQFKAYVDAVKVNVTSGQITITFTPQVENPQINAIEVIPQ
jgi:Malectin domain